MQLDKLPNTTAFFNDVEHLYFSGTSYLGVAALPEFQEIVFKNMKNLGTSYGSSRNANLKLNVYKRGEDFLSTFINHEDCTTVSSGTIAGQFAIATLEKIVDTFYFMPKTHPAILPKNALPVFEENGLNSLLINQKEETICIVVDAIAALETKPFNFDFLLEISSLKKVFLLVDESHSFGILGENGNGISSTINIQKNIEIVTVSSLTKAFGINGGVISGTKNFIKLIRENPLFVGSSGMNPAFLESFLDGQDLYKNQQKKLQENCTYVYENLKHLDKINISKNYPVFFINDENIADYLLTKKIVITSFYYPTSSKKINRIVLNANHTKEQLDILIESLLSY
ncbi:7-keto-8-aminopelargonate synthetase [Polaribacter sp. KT25b]|uniref:aminotransferase class I/II-fold pyridoxal phosphate-dependent enzyme n=1 Tax=Polaribacter sp. KT25b TaxID=1855336 RepID=UPI00087A508E|nr:aminotransferase class I/II-fold pyridoxal phosphate-dependent enzyme [Polaribacter sp. KT25b]SDR65648.1 7-keto-8-aminopelargonate synthetase [Polaribacter sp. KT25b]